MPCLDTPYVQDDAYFRDETGTERADFESARKEAVICLPQLAGDALPRMGEKQAFSVLVRDESGTPVYSASLNFVGIRLSNRTEL